MEFANLNAQTKQLVKVTINIILTQQNVPSALALMTNRSVLKSVRWIVLTKIQTMQRPMRIFKQNMTNFLVDLKDIKWKQKFKLY